MTFALKENSVKTLTNLEIKQQKRKCKKDVFIFRPESLGLIPAVVFLLVTIIEQTLFEFTSTRQIEYNTALLSICLCVLLGFIDDVIDLKWRYKFIVPTIASFPLLAAYGG